MSRRLLLLALLALGPSLSADGPAPSPSRGPVAAVVTARPARLQPKDGAAVEVPAGASLELVAADTATGTVRVRYQGREGTMAADALRTEAPGPVPSASATPLPAPVALPPGTAPLTAKPSNYASLPPEVRAMIQPAQSNATAAARPGGLPSPKTAPVGPLAPGPGAGSAPPPPVPGPTVTFRSKEEAERYLETMKARQEADAKARAATSTPAPAKTP